MIRNVIFGLIILLSYSCGSKSNNSESFDRISSSIDKLVADNNIPGLNFSMSFPDGRQFSYSSGFADVKNREKLNPKHIMFSGSIGKTYAVAIIMQLVENGKIDLKSRFLDYFPKTEWLKKIPNIQEITVEMLLQHTSGLPRYINDQGVWDSLYHNPDKIWNYKDRLSFIFDKDAVHQAGKGWAYSDSNYLLIGMLIEKICGTYYYDELKNRMLTPENLNKTFPAIKREIDNLPVGYSRLDTFFRMPEIVVSEGKYVFNPQMEWTGGGMVSTTSDLAKWAEIYYKGKLFSKTSLEKIITPNSNGKNTGENEAYGMGSFIYETQNGKVYGHTGFVPGFNAIMAYYPKLKIAAAIQINCDYAAEKMKLIEYMDFILQSVEY